MAHTKKTHGKDSIKWREKSDNRCMHDLYYFLHASADCLGKRTHNAHGAGILTPQKDTAYEH